MNYMSREIDHAELKRIVGKFTWLRESRGISARSLSLKIGKSAGYIYELEAGRLNISLVGFLDLCEELGVSPKTMFE